MVYIKISKGLDIPIKGEPTGAVMQLVPSGHAEAAHPTHLSLSLRPFSDIKFRLLVKPGDTVKIGQPLAEDKESPGRMFVSPAGGTIAEIRRGLKRVLQDIVIETAPKEELLHHPRITLTREAILERMLSGGLFANIRSRPFDRLADPTKIPRAIFVRAIESALFIPPAEMQVDGHETAFKKGLETLGKLTDGKVHLVYREGTPCKAFTEAAGVEKHSAEGPHPIGNASLHIEQIDPVKGLDDVLWTLSALDVVTLGYLVGEGRYHYERVVSIAGPGILPDKTGYFRLRQGFPVKPLIAGRVEKGEMRLISGDPLMGKKVEADDFLGYYHTAFTVVPENVEREFLHFMGLGLNKYSFSRAYMSGHIHSDKKYDFTTSQHGEHRPFIDSSLYDKVQPLNIPTMLLVKAVMAEDFELADRLGLLDVASEDFALPTFVCPSKMEMTHIMEKGIKQYAQEVS